MSKIWQSRLYRNFRDLYLPILAACDWQIKNSSYLLHIAAITVPLGGVTEDRQAHLLGF